MVIITFKVFSEEYLLSRYTLAAKVLDIGKQDVILGLSSLEEHWFLVDTKASSLRKDCSGLAIPYSIR